MIAAGQGEEARHLLLELSAILRAHGEVNWIRGVNAAIEELTCTNGALNEEGFGNAKSIYKTMNEGGRGFAEYYVWLSDEDDRIAANHNLDDLRVRLWSVFGL